MIRKLSFFAWCFSGFCLFSSLKASEHDRAAVRLMQEIKCPVCQGQSIYDSQTPLAHALRLEVAQKMEEGLSANVIKQELKERYGDAILFNPPYGPSTWILWLGPFLLLVGGGIAVIIKIYSTRKQRSRHDSF